MKLESVCGQISIVSVCMCIHSPKIWEPYANLLFFLDFVSFIIYRYISKCLYIYIYMYIIYIYREREREKV